ncbi:Murein DD-endopeptidase MepM and murein hydrolase activator NlpD, contain LysM domain [Loktanella sp. DSM 29012]|uniref:peptidoglycan DD-metalloendopeptidase family protein n=1 Tax=Loktanella sp. DSM 29012 TaxID=1881056 RepID=UPI0008BA5A47|nr:peptidoglycan DD-metalloendopeptidase family protein [Loktanella sp. DSM 29012]SEQ67428.1 Murein DD-endopeptidase MepM and murein hydrolase activator NlpD, contain LysM domain [Loktanella sp. DSM 29012]
MTQTRRNAALRLTFSCAGIALMAACDAGLPDIDLRDRTGAFDTSPAVGNLPDRPDPDQRGVITYADYQVAVARRGDTVASIASRVGVDPATLASFNGIEKGVTLRDGEVLALPTRVPGAQTTVPLDVTAVATTALDRADATSGGLAVPAASPAQTTATQPIRHRVERGETAFSISRLYNVPVGTLAEWNGLDSSLTVREGQFILVPQGGGAADPAGGPITAPGIGSTSPVPPSAAAPLPASTPSVAAPVTLPDAPDLTTAAPTVSETASAPPPPPPPAPAPAATPAANEARFVRPLAGAIIRDYSPGRNEGIDIAATAGTTVKAADSGTVAAVTQDTSGTSIVVVKHADNLLTVYTNLENLSVAKGDSVARGGNLGQVGAGDPTFVHFEVRRGLNSVDPNEFLP